MRFFRFLVPMASGVMEIRLAQRYLILITIYHFEHYSIFGQFLESPLNSRISFITNYSKIVLTIYYLIIVSHSIYRLYVFRNV